MQKMNKLYFSRIMVGDRAFSPLIIGVFGVLEYIISIFLPLFVKKFGLCQKVYYFCTRFRK